MERDKKDVPSINVDYFSELTGDIPEPDEAAPNGEDVGERIAQIRGERGLSLEELSRMTGFGVDVLAGIENKTVHPQLGTIMRLSKALDSAMCRLISGTGNKTFEITRRGERKPVKRSTSEKGSQRMYSYFSLAHDVQGRNMEALMVELEDVADVEKSVHDGEEFIFVLEGTAHLEIGEDCFDLEPGDSVYYLSTTPHSITGKGGKARILAVLYES
ncbi:MAG: helix-turn-helix domain-containing protein [Desulfatibacillaceae bacterium]